MLQYGARNKQLQEFSRLWSICELGGGVGQERGIVDISGQDPASRQGLERGKSPKNEGGRGQIRAGR